MANKKNHQTSLLSSNQEKLSKELTNILNQLEDDINSNIKNLNNFLSANSSEKDLKFILDSTRNQNQETVLHYVVRNNFIEITHRLLELRANPNVKDQFGKTPLHLAAESQSDYDDIIFALLGKEARVDIQDKNGNTPLHSAAHCGYTNAIELLIEHIKSNGQKESINLKNKDGDTALYLALNNADDDRNIDPFFDKLINVDFSIKNSEGITPLLTAVRNGSKALAEQILNEKETSANDVDNKYGASMLHHAMANYNIGLLTYNTHNSLNQPDFECEQEHEVVNGVLKAILYKIRSGKIEFNINCTDKYGNTPLFVAVDNGRSEAIEGLIDGGADVSIVNKNGHTVFHYAIKKRSLEMLNTLLPKREKKDENGVTIIDEYGCTVEEIDAGKAKELLGVIDTGGNTLLHHAVKVGCSEKMIDFLVEYGVDINKKNKNGVAPIHIAAKYGHPGLISCLIKNKANCSTKCGDLTEANIDKIGRKFPVVMDYINIQGSNSTINIKNDTNYKEATSILIAAEGGNVDVVDILASWGAKHDIQDSEGWDALLIAIKKVCSKDCTGEEREGICKAIAELASDANSGILRCLDNMKRHVLEEQLRDRIKSLAIGRLSNNDKILNVSVVPQVTGEKLGLIQMSVETRRLGQEKHYISRLFSKDRFLEPVTDREFQMYESRVCNKLKNIIENALKLSSDNEVQKIVKGAFRNALSAIEGKSSAAALAGGNIDFDNDFYKGIDSCVEEAPELYCDNPITVKQKDIELHEDQERELSPEMNKGLRKFDSRVNEFWERAGSATKIGKLRSLEIDGPTFFLEYSEDSIVEVAKITDGARNLVLTQGEVAFGSNIIKIGQSEVEVITKGGIRNYTDLTDNSDIILTFYTSLEELEVRLYPDKQNKDLIRVEVQNQGKWEKLKSCNEEIGKNCLLGGLSVSEAIEKGHFVRSSKLYQYSETMSSAAQTMNRRQQLLQDLRNIESNIVKKEKNFDIKTHLIEIFKALSKLSEEKENVSKIDLAKVAEKEGKRLGLEGRYNWNEIFGLKKAVFQNIEQELPLSNDLYRQDKLASSVSNKVEKCTTKGDGNCFFHAVFGDSSSGVYKADRAQEMRQEWHKFLSQFESLNDPKMPKALRERLSLVFHNVFPMRESDFCTSNLYKEYLNKVSEQSYFIYVEEVPILASLASTEIELYYTQGSPCKIKPNPDMINADYKTSQELWGGKVQEMIYLEENHYSKAKFTTQLQKQMQEQGDFSCYPNPSRCNITEPRVESYQKGLFVR
ncbi:ankyrin repeat domain-containing protein [Wolbachia endosymbiont (group A) of Colletes cunicularius]|uniref:ankyrin repeat domain-containing protein n=1 Tax=Wolbachia endosymbiont (group A) of Colletes cunicularius TaxID=3139321 RepID=UPI0035C89B34